MGKLVQTSHGIFEEINETQAQEIERLASQANAFTRSGILSAAERGINQQTVEAVQKASTVQRDQSYSGNNAGFVGYILEDGAKFVIPQLTPVRNMTPRRPMPGIDKINYRTVLDFFNGAGPSIGAGILDQYGTPKKVQYKFKDLNYTAKMISTSDLITEETQIYGKSFEGDVLAVASSKLIPALMQIEEVWLINSGEKSWTPPPPIFSATATTGGTLAALNYWVAVTAKNANGETLPTTIVNMGATTGTTSTLSFILFSNGLDDSVTQYNVYVGTGSTKPATSAMWLQSAGNFASGAVPGQTSGVVQGYQIVTLSSLATSGTALSSVTANTAIRYASTASVNTGAPLTFDAMQALIYNNYNPANISTFGVGGEAPYVVQPANAAGTLALTDTDTLLENMFLNSHADPDYLFMSVKDHKKISYLIAQGTNARVLLNADNAQSQANLVAGYRATAYINQTTGKVIPIKMLPYLQQGTLMFASYELPFQVQGLDDPPFRVGYNRDMYSRIYPPDQSHPTQTLVAAYLNEALINEYLGGWGLINGITLT